MLVQAALMVGAVVAAAAKDGRSRSAYDEKIRVGRELVKTVKAAEVPAVIREDAASQETAEALPETTLRSDAWLADVFFLDANRGWAVGDRGVIWHTANAGRSWSLQESGVACGLRSVFFLDDKLGWAVGGQSLPYLHTGTGVVLSTMDGGQTWQRNAKLLLPSLRQIRFLSEKRGWAVGAASAMFPSGIFQTIDGGWNWTPMNGSGTADWQSADFLRPGLGVVAGGDHAAVIENNRIEPVPLPGLGQRNLNRLKLVLPGFGWLVGDGGFVQTSSDAGHTWQTPPGLPREMAAFDFHALAVIDSDCWIAGTPGNHIFHTSDGGRSWEISAPTGVTIPLHALAFANRKQGWAVGALGTILATDDGGRTWRIERAGGRRAALLALVGQPQDIPLELIARHGGNDGYLAVANVAGRNLEIPTPHEIPAAQRAHEAVLAVGGCGAETAWQFPLRQPGLRPTNRQILDVWNRTSGGRDAEPLVAYAVRQIRLWRPDVVVTGDTQSPNDALQSIVAQAALEAVRHAADPAYSADLPGSAGLGPWQVKKVFAIVDRGVSPHTLDENGAGASRSSASSSFAAGENVHGGVETATGQPLARLGRSPADVAAMPHGLLEDRFSPPPATIAVRLLAGTALGTGAPLDNSPGTGSALRGDLFTGLAVSVGGDSRRMLGEVSGDRLAVLQRAAQRRRHTQAILEQAQQDPQKSLRLLGESDELTRGLDPTGAAQVLFELAQRYQGTGHGDLAAETLRLLVTRFPNDPDASMAIVWLLQFYASEEAATRFDTNDPTRAIEKAADAGTARLRQAVELGRAIERTRPDLFAEPAIRYPLASVYRRLGEARQVERLYLPDRRGTDRDAWRTCAQGEAWLIGQQARPAVAVEGETAVEPRAASPKPLLSCVLATARPRLDGKLDDAVWQQAKPVTLQSPLHDDAQWPAVVMLAHDAEFLYIGISCRMAPGGQYGSSDGVRQRDADLSGHDRVDILLDVDRDYATYFRLTIDHRGWAAESCLGDFTWNPRWFVAATVNGDTWNAEAAIPLAELALIEESGRQRPPERVWALGIQRTVPGVGFQSWTTPASTTVLPEGFGHLRFE